MNFNPRSCRHLTGFKYTYIDILTYDDGEQKVSIAWGGGGRSRIQVHVGYRTSNAGNARAGPSPSPHGMAKALPPKKQHQHVKKLTSKKNKHKCIFDVLEHFRYF